MESADHFKSLQPARFFTFSNHWAVTLRPCPWKRKINTLTLCTSGSTVAAAYHCHVCASNLHAVILQLAAGFSGFCVSVSLSERLLGLLLHEHLGGVCAICAFSQQVITKCSLTSHSAQLDSVCWHGQGQLWEGAGWQQLDSTHYGVKGKASESCWWKLQWGEDMWGKMPASFPTGLAVSSCVILSF